MTDEKQVYRDGQLNFLGGGDSLTHPMLLREDKVAFAVNCVFRGGFASQRPGMSQKALTFRRSSDYDWIKDGTVQGWGVYYNQGTVENIVAISGRIFAVNLSTFEVYERTPAENISGASTLPIPAIGDTIDVTVSTSYGIEPGHPVMYGTYEYSVVSVNDLVVTLRNVTDSRLGLTFGSGTLSRLAANASYADQAWMIQADRYFLIQDGISSAIILDGPVNRRSNRNVAEVPAGRQMAYGMGRIWIAVGDNEVVAGDIIGSPTGILRFTENTYLGEGGTFKIPNNEGPIRGLRFINTLDSSLGQGPLLVGTTGAIFSLNAPTDRTTWQNLTDPIQTYALVNYGFESQDSLTLVNGDVFYRSKDGVRSFILARREFGTWGNVPVSSELADILKDDDESLIKYVSTILFDNRLLITVNPQLFRRRPYFRGIASLDFAPISSMGQKGRPAFDMLWSGVQPSGLFKAAISDEDRAFAWAVNADGHNELWEISKRSDFDNTDGRIESSVDTRALLFGNPYEMKRLKRGELFVDELKGDIDFTIYYRPDGYKNWIEWTSLTLCQQYRQCETDALACNTITPKRAGYRNRLKLSEPQLVDIESVDTPAPAFYTVQLRIKWTGRARLVRFLLVAEQVVEDLGYPDDN